VLAPDHKTFATVSNHTPYGKGPVVCLWDADTGKEIRHIDDADFEYYRAFFLKSENLLVTLGVSRKPVEGKTFAYAMHFWDPATGKKASDRIETTGYHFEPWAFSTDEKWLASASRIPPVLVRERKTGKVLAEWKGDGTRILDVAFSPDGKTVAVCCVNGIDLWDWNGNGAARRRGDLPIDEVGGLRFSPDGRWITASVYKEGLRVWEAKDWKEVRRFEGVNDVRFFPDGKRMVSTDTGVIWDIESGKQLGKFEDCAHCLALGFSADGRTATGYALGRIRRWDAETGKDQSPPAPTANRVMIHQLGFLPDGKAVVSASPDGAVRVWDATTGKEVRTMVRGTVWDHQSTIMRVTPDGTVVVARGNRMSFFKGEGKAEEVTLAGFPDGVESLNVSPDGKTLVLAAGGFRDGKETKRLMEVWDLPSRKAVASFPPPERTSLEGLGVSCGKVIAANVGDRICLLNANTGAIERTLDRRPERPLKNKPGEKGGDGGAGYSWFHGIHSLTFSPAGDLLVSAGHPSGGLKLLDVESGKTRHVLVPSAEDTTHYNLHNAVFSPDGRMIASESSSGVVDVWEASSGQRRRQFRGHRSYQTTLAFSPDGAKLATGNRDATILIWDVFGVATADPKDAAPLKEEELKLVWTQLRDEDAEKACLAMGRLMRSPEVSGPYLKRQLLGRKNTEVAKLKTWIADLDDDHFDKRETASTELAKRLLMAEPLLKENLAGKPSQEARRRIEDLLARVGSEPLPPETIRDLRALEVIEHIVPTAIGELARKLRSGDYDPPIAAAAEAARKRLAARDP
jgi:WD40 repeat protein